jgi:hypothetical protein
MTAPVRVSEILIPAWDPLDADPALVSAVSRLEVEEHEIALVNGPLSEPMSWVLLSENE